MTVLENLAGGFVILVILSLLLIVIGFLSDSASKNSLGEPTEPRSRNSLFSGGVLWLLLAGAWGYSAATQYAEGQIEWIWLLGYIALSVMSLSLSIQHFREARLAE